jgi:hypothetical protein
MTSLPAGAERRTRWCLVRVCASGCFPPRGRRHLRLAQPRLRRHLPRAARLTGWLGSDHLSPDSQARRERGMKVCSTRRCSTLGSDPHQAPDTLLAWCAPRAARLALQVLHADARVFLFQQLLSPGAARTGARTQPWPWPCQLACRQCARGCLPCLHSRVPNARAPATHNRGV